MTYSKWNTTTHSLSPTSSISPSGNLRLHHPAFSPETCLHWPNFPKYWDLMLGNMGDMRTMRRLCSPHDPNTVGASKSHAELFEIPVTSCSEHRKTEQITHALVQWNTQHVQSLVQSMSQKGGRFSFFWWILIVTGVLVERYCVVFMSVNHTELNSETETQRGRHKQPYSTHVDALQLYEGEQQMPSLPKSFCSILQHRGFKTPRMLLFPSRAFNYSLWLVLPCWGWG